jgi:hypothetical protein
MARERMGSRRRRYWNGLRTKQAWNGKMMYELKSKWIMWGTRSKRRIDGMKIFINKPRHSLGGYSPASHRGVPGLRPSQVMWDLWWTKWHWGRFSPSTSVSPANSPSTNSNTLIINHPGLVQ